MIIPDDTAKTPITETSEVQHLPTESPPAYYTSISQTTYVPQNISQSSHTAEQTLLFPQRYKRSPITRFLYALFIACMLWISVALFLRSFFLLVNKHSDNDRHEGEKIDPRFDYDIPSGIIISGCVQGDSWRQSQAPTGTHQNALYFAQATFELPLKETNVFLMSRGQLSSGTLDVITSPRQPFNTSKVVVNIRYLRKEAQSWTKVCKLSHKAGQEPEGVGIFTPKWPNGRPDDVGTVSFETTVILPEVAAGEEPLFVKGFATDLPNILQRFADLNQKVHFGNLELGGSNEHIAVKSLSATAASIRNKNGHIKGTFNVTSSIVLETTNSPVMVDIGLRSINSSNPECFVRTTNGPIEAAISLIGDSTYYGGSYSIYTATTNGPTSLEFPTHPLGSKLYATATTTNGPARVHLNPAYEGGFRLESPGAVSVDEDKSVEDPSGVGRKRILRYKYINSRSQGKTIIIGSVLWGLVDSRRSAPGHGDGLVTIKNTKSPLTFGL